MARTNAYAQNDCNILGTANCTYADTVNLTPDAMGVIIVDSAYVHQELSAGHSPDNTHVLLVIPAGDHLAASFTGLDYCRTTIKIVDSGEATFAGYEAGNTSHTNDPTIQILDCHHLELDGDGIKVLDAFGTGALRVDNQSSVYIGETSSCIDVHHLDVQCPSGFAGIMAKDSPLCRDGEVVNIADDTAAFMHDIYIHHNYVHNVPQGEGIYCGDSFFLTGKRFSCGGTQYYYPQKIENVRIYSNFLEEIGWDAIQLGSCVAGGRIHDNVCVEYGTLGESSMANGIQLGLGTMGAVCERNFVRQSAERADNFGNGILCQGVGDNCIRNNIVYNTMENAIFVNERTAYINEGSQTACHPVLNDSTATCVGFAFIDDDVRDSLHGVNIVHNTLMYPAKAPKLGRDQNGVRLLSNNSLFLPPTGAVINNNLIFGLPTGAALRLGGDYDAGCYDNLVVNQYLETVRDEYLRSFGAYPLDDPNAPYAAAIARYFVAPAVSEEDNFFRSPSDFYPVHASITGTAAEDCSQTCAATEDFFGTARSQTAGCADDYGAVELGFPAFTLSEDCAEDEFSIQAVDTGGTFSWTFAGNVDTTSNPTFPNPGVGIYELTYQYISSDGCRIESGTLPIELTCSCPCDNPQGDNINIQAGTGTSWRNTELFNHVSFPFPNSLMGLLDLDSRCLSINGRLLIDGGLFPGTDPKIDLKIINGYIRMQPSAEIVVLDDAGLWIQGVNGQDNGNGSGIHGCGYMWEGIDVEKGGRIIVENTVIRDAITAIGITDSTDIRIQDNHFENNFRGIDIAPLVDLTAGDPVIGNDPVVFSLTIRPNGLSGNLFETTGTGLKGTVDSIAIPAGTRGDVGIKMGYLNLGLVQGDLTSNTNTFQNLRHGVYANQSNLILMRNEFRTLDYGVRLFNTPALVIENTFASIALRGVESLDPALLLALDNTMNDVAGRGINYEGVDNPTFYLLQRNTIAAQDHGINLEASHATTYLDVSNNDLTLLPPGPGGEDMPGRAALRVYSIGNPTQDSSDVLNIQIAQIEDQLNTTINGYGDGVVLENMSNVDIERNEVAYQSPSGGTAASHGIRLANSLENYVAENAVQAPGGFPELRNIYLSGSPNNDLFCNSTAGGGIGLGFYGTCDSTLLRTTVIGSHDFGLLCVDGAIIGPQPHRGNTWLTAANSYDSLAAVHLGSDEDVEGSAFFVKEQPGSVFRPVDIDTPNSPGSTWFDLSQVESAACEDPPLPEAGNPGFPGRTVAEGDYATGKYATVHRWEAEKRLFTRLYHDVTLRGSEVWLQDFYNQEENAAVGKYVKMDERFKTLLHTTGTERQRAEELMLSIQDSVKVLTQIGESYRQAVTEADSTALESAWLQQYANVSGYFAEWQQLAATIVNVQRRTSLACKPTTPRYPKTFSPPPTRN